MSRRHATCFNSLFAAGLAVLLLAGCGHGGHEGKAPEPVAAVKPSDESKPTPTATPAPDTQAPATPGESAPAPAVTPAPVAEQATPPAPAAETNPKPQQQPDALQWMKDSEARRVDYERRLDEAKSNLETANLQTAAWERNVLAFKNPFLARPQLSPEDSQAIAGMNGTERVRWAEARLSSVSLARDAAQKALEDLKANPPQN
jgi:type IV secretory pathway VirB10-like protein